MEFIKHRESVWKAPMLADLCVAVARRSIRPNVWDGVARLGGAEWVKDRLVLGFDMEEYLELGDNNQWCGVEW